MPPSQPLILVVEDDDTIRESLVELLEEEGYAIQTAQNGQVALDYLAQASKLPDLILLDLMMPVMDGFAFCEARTKLAPLMRVPVVVMSADGHVTEKKGKTGATDYVRKPLDIDVLTVQVAGWLKHSPPAPSP